MWIKSAIKSKKQIKLFNNGAFSQVKCFIMCTTVTEKQLLAMKTWVLIKQSTWSMYLEKKKKNHASKSKMWIWDIKKLDVKRYVVNMHNEKF